MIAVRGLLLLLLAGSGAARAGAQPATRPADTAPARAVLCPVTGRPVDRDCVTRFRGRWVYLASREALRQFEQDPYAYAEGVQAQWQADRPLRVQVRCPVTGEPVAPDIYCGQGAAAVFFATAAARDRWLKDSAPYRARLEGECYSFQTACPACGGDISPAAFEQIDGRRVYFCCRGCAQALAAERDACLAAVDRQIENNRSRWEQQRRGTPEAPPPASQPARPPATQPAAAQPAVPPPR